MYKTNSEQIKYEVLNLSTNRIRIYDTHEKFLNWLARSILKSYHSGRLYARYDNFNFSSTDSYRSDTGTYYDTKREIYVPIASYLLRDLIVYRNGVLFDIRVLEDEVIRYVMSSYYSKYPKYLWNRKRNNNLEYGDILVKKGWRNNCNICYAYRKDPVPLVHKYHYDKYNSKIGYIVRMVNSEEYKKYGRPGRYPKCGWDYKEFRSNYGNRCWKDCTKKRHQWEK